MSIDLSTARAIAQMLCPTRRIDGLAAPDPKAYADLVEGCQDNKVPLLSLDAQALVFASFYASAAFKKAHAEERALWAASVHEHLAVQRALDDAGVRNVLIKSAGIAPSFPYRSDNSDVLVPLADGPRVREILLALGYIEVKTVEEPHKFLFRKFHLGSSVGAFHLHEFVGWGTGFMDDAQVLENARPSEDAPDLLIPSPEDGVMITMAHAFYEDKEIKLGDLWKVIHLLAGRDLDWESMYAQAQLRGWVEGLDTCIILWAELERKLYGAHSFPQDVVERAQAQAPAYCRRYLQARLTEPARFPFRVSFRFSKRHYYRKVFRDQMLSTWQKVVDAYLHSWAGIKRRLPFKLQRPMLITFSGIDGSGKTVHAEMLRDALELCEVDVKPVWSRGGSSALTDAVIRLVKPLLGGRRDMDVEGDTREAKVKRKRVWLQRPLLRGGWMMLVAFDLLLRYWAQVAWRLARGQVVVADRYTYDALVELVVLTDSPKVTRSLAAWALMHLCPRPHLAYYLDVSPERALARKPDELLGFLERQSLIYRRMAMQWGVQIVDANQDLGPLGDHLLHKSLRAYYDR